MNDFAASPIQATDDTDLHAELCSGTAIRPVKRGFFAMKLQTPKVTTPTLAPFSWELDTSFGPHAEGASQIVPAT